MLIFFVKYEHSPYPLGLLEDVPGIQCVKQPVQILAINQRLSSGPGFPSMVTASPLGCSRSIKRNNNCYFPLSKLPKQMDFLFLYLQELYHLKKSQTVLNSKCTHTPSNSFSPINTVTYTQTHIQTYTQTHTHSNTPAHMCVHAQTCMHTYSYIHIPSYTQTATHLQIYSPTHAHTCSCAHMSTHSYLHTYGKT